MLRASSVFHALVGALYIAGCGGSGDGSNNVVPFTGPYGETNEVDMLAPADPLPDGVDPSRNPGAPAGGEATDPDLTIDPMNPAQPEPAQPPALTIGNGRLVDGTCTPICADAATDADPQGMTDGWGYEDNRSCLVPSSPLELESELCDIIDGEPMPVLPPVIPEGNTPRPAGNLSTGFFVSNGRLFDRLGADFVMRGINHPVAWFQNNALNWLDEIETTGSNSVRLVWETTSGSTQVIRAAIERSVELGMVPMVELHDVTGSPDVNGPERMAQYYVDEMRNILLEFEPYLLVNIANEWGPFQSTGDAWVQAYRQAISVLRDAGINHTLVIDANDYGQRGNTIVTRGQELLDFDPQHNILFSTHMYQAYEDPQTILDVLRGAQMRSLPIIVGEFGFQHGNRNGQPIPVPYTAMLDEAARIAVGYLAWSWTGNSGGVEYLDLSENGSASQLTGWGDDIVNGMNGIRATAAPASVFTAP